MHRGQDGSAEPILHGDADDVLRDVDDRIAAAEQEQADRHYHAVDRPCGRGGRQAEHDGAADDDPVRSEARDERRWQRRGQQGSCGEAGDDESELPGTQSETVHQQRIPRQERGIDRAVAGEPEPDTGGRPRTRTAGPHVPDGAFAARRSRPAWPRMSRASSTPTRLSHRPSVMKMSTIAASTGTRRRSDHHT